MRWSEFKKQVDEYLKKHNIQDAEIEYIDISALMEIYSMDITIDKYTNELQIL